MIEYVGPIEKQTLENPYFRRVLFTGKHTQLVVMCLGPGEEIGGEVHESVDQFFRIEPGEAKFVFKACRPLILTNARSCTGAEYAVGAPVIESLVTLTLLDFLNVLVV